MKVDKNKTVSFDIDSQNGFTPNCPGELPVTDGHLIVKELNENAKKAKYRYASKDAHPSNGLWTSDKENPQYSNVEGVENVDIRWNQHCVVGTYGFELIDGLPEMKDYDFFVYKGVERDMHPYSPCFHNLDKTISTGVIEKAKYDGITTFIVGGLALDYCVNEGVKDLLKAGFKVIVNLSSTKSIGEAKFTIKALENLGAIFVKNAEEITN